MPSFSKLLGFVLLSTAAAAGSLRSDVSDPMTGNGMTNMNQMDTPTDHFEQFEESFHKMNDEHEESFHKMNEERDLSHDAQIEDLKQQIEEHKSHDAHIEDLKQQIEEHDAAHFKLEDAIVEANEKYHEEHAAQLATFCTEQETMSAEHMQAAKKYHGEHLAQLANDASDGETGGETDDETVDCSDANDDSLLEQHARSKTASLLSDARPRGRRQTVSRRRKARNQRKRRQRVRGKGKGKPRKRRRRGKGKRMVKKSRL